MYTLTPGYSICTPFNLKISVSSLGGLLQHFYDIIYNYDIICYRCLVTGGIGMLWWTVGKWSGTKGFITRGMGMKEIINNSYTFLQLTNVQLIYFHLSLVYRVMHL